MKILKLITQIFTLICPRFVTQKMMLGALMSSCVFVTSISSADLRGLYGVGSASQSMSGAARAHSMDAFAVLENPALLSDHEDFRVSLSLQNFGDSLQNIDNVVTENTRTGSSQIQRGSVRQDQPDQNLIGLGVIVPFGQTDWRPRFGLSVFSPVDKLLETQTQDNYQPRYVFTQSDLARPDIAGGLSFDPWTNVSVGLSIRAFLNTWAHLKSRLPSKSQGKSSSMNSTITAKPGVSPLLGVRAKFNDHRVAFNYAAIRDMRMTIDHEGDIYLLGADPIIFEMDTSMFYDPETFSFSYAYVLDQPWMFFAAADYERWSKFDGAVTRINFKSYEGSFQQMQESTSMKDIFVLRGGVSYRTTDKHHLRAGYAYRPTPVPDLTGPTNFLDADRHIFGLGSAWKLDSFFGWDHICQLDLHFQAHRLIPKDVVKVSSTDIGAPQFAVGGWLWNIGGTLSTSF